MVREWKRWAWGAAAAAFLVVLPQTAARADELPRRVYERCIRSAVKVFTLAPNGEHFASGSGSLIDPRGYVLTNFHVIGRTRPELGGLTGELFHPQGKVLLGLVDSDRDQVEPQWEGRVVRGDPTLDLALVRIVRSLRTGQRVAGVSFPAVRFAPRRSVRVGTAVWALGFPLSVRTINVTAGAVNGFQLNYRGEVAWIRTDAQFNPGNSGGMLVDRKCRLVGVPTQVRVANPEAGTLTPVEKARPAERVPRAWLRDLRRGHIEDTRIDDVPALELSRPTYLTISGDRGMTGVGGQYFFHLPPIRPARVEANMSVEMAVYDARGHRVATGEGRLRIPQEAPEQLDLLVFIPASQTEAPRIAFRFVPERVRPQIIVQQVVGAGAAAGPASAQQVASGRLQADVVPLGGGGAAPAAAAAPVAGSVQVRGVVVDPAGRPAAGALVLLGKPGVDLAARALQMGQGRISQQQFMGFVAATGRTAASGSFALTGAVPGSRQVVLVVHPQTSSMGLQTVLVPVGQPVVQVAPIRLATQ